MIWLIALNVAWIAFVVVPTCRWAFKQIGKNRREARRLRISELERDMGIGP